MKTLLTSTKVRLKRGLGAARALLHHLWTSLPRRLPLLIVALALVVLAAVGIIVVEAHGGVDRRLAGAAAVAKATVQPAFAIATALPAQSDLRTGRMSAATAIPTLPLINARTTATPVVEAPETDPSGDLAKVRPTPELCNDPVGQMVTDSLKSKVLGQELPVNVYLPPCYDASKYAYPTLYLLQGSGFEIGEWIDDGATRVADIQMSLGILPPFIIVMPASDINAGDNSRFLNSTGGRGSWEDLMVNELVPMMDHEYSTWQAREGRAIGGISRGAYWALQISFDHPELFSSVGGHSPAITPDKLVGVPDDFSMLSMAKSISDVSTLRIFLDAGATDWAQSGVDALSSQLDAKHIAFSMSSGDGGHEDAYWESRMDDYLAFYAANWPMSARARSDVIGSAKVARMQP